MFFLSDILRRQVVHQPDATAMTYRGEGTSYRELQDRSHALGHALIDAGVVPGEHVAILGKNSREYVISYFGCAAAGAIITCVNYRLADPELAYVIRDCEARVLLLDHEFVETWERIAGECPRIEYVVRIGEGEGGAHPHFWDFIGGRSTAAPDVTRRESDVALQMYTSGTTGVPKGAMLTHRNLVQNSMSMLIELDFQREDAFLVCAPLYHMAAGICSLVALLRGGRIVVHRDFDPAATVKGMEEGEVTHALLIPAMILFLVQMPDIEKRDFRSLKSITYGASPIPYEIVKRAMQVFGCDFAQGYGQTEATAVLTMLLPADHRAEGERGERLLTSAGREIYGVEVRVVDEEGKEVPDGQWGEVVGRGPNLMKGYWKMPERTAETIRDGWLWTGDIGYRDEEGYLYIVDRSKDMIISGGENIYPREIEEVLFGHPEVADAAVIGVPNDAGWGEEVKACVVPKPGTEPSEQALIDFCRERLAGYKCPKSIDFIEAVPRNLSGKVLKKDLRAPYWEGRERLVN